MPEKRIRVLYLVYWGALEPLGQSLVVPAIRRLAEMGVDLTLISFEKEADLINTPSAAALQGQLRSLGVRWRPLRYHKTPKWPATAYDALCAMVVGLSERRRGAFDVVHARTFVAGPIGFAIAGLLGARFVFHSEGFYPDEQVDGGVWREGSFVHRMARRVESFLNEHADALIVLTERARNVVLPRRPAESAASAVVVAPSAVDLEAFQPSPATSARQSPPSLVYLGSVGLRYRLDEAGRFVVALRQLSPGASLTVVSRAERDLVESMLDSAGLPREAWTLKELPHDAVPAELIRHDAGLLFWPQGLSEHGCSPTKVGEYWASGLPVVTTPNIGDTDTIVREQRVGVVVDPAAVGAFNDAAARLLTLLGDPALRGRCRKAAESAYSLEIACLRQKSLYETLSP